MSGGIAKTLCTVKVKTVSGGEKLFSNTHEARRMAAMLFSVVKGRYNIYLIWSEGERIRAVLTERKYTQ
jgi:hypothetical protein